MSSIPASQVRQPGWLETPKFQENQLYANQFWDQMLLPWYLNLYSLAFIYICCEVVLSFPVWILLGCPVQSLKTSVGAPLKLMPVELMSLVFLEFARWNTRVGIASPMGEEVLNWGRHFHCTNPIYFHRRPPTMWIKSTNCGREGLWLQLCWPWWLLLWKKCFLLMASKICFEGWPFS